MKEIKENNWNKIQKDILLQNNSERRKIEFIKAKNNQNNQNKEKNTFLNEKKDQNKILEKKKVIEIYSNNNIKKYLKWEQVKRHGPGMFNHGNTCFLNSTLQCLVHTPPLAQILLNDPLAIRGFSQQENQNIAILLLFKKLLQDVWSQTTQKAISPRVMVNSIRRLSRQFRPCQQEDAHEYLRTLIDTMNNDILKVNRLPIYGGQNTPPSPGVVNIYDTTLISRIFTGKLCNILTCNKCKYRSKTWNSFQDISLNIGAKIQSINDAISLFTKVEKLDAGNEWLCDGCKRKVQASKQLTISTPPVVLVLHLKRFSFGGMSDKIKKHISFEVQLSLPIQTDDNQKKEVSYDLYGIIVHHGHSVHSGHYIAFIKASNNQWYEMDDSTVSQVSIQTVLKQQAYILFYIQSKFSVDETSDLSNSTPTPKTATVTTTTTNTIPVAVDKVNKNIKESNQISSEIDSKGLNQNGNKSNKTTIETISPVVKKNHPRDDDDDDEAEDLVSEMLFLAKKHKIDIPNIPNPTKVENNKNVNVSNNISNINNKKDDYDEDKELEEDFETVSRPTRLLKRRFGIFRFVGKLGKFNQWRKQPNKYDTGYSALDSYLNFTSEDSDDTDIDNDNDNGNGNGNGNDDEIDSDSNSDSNSEPKIEEVRKVVQKNENKSTNIESTSKSKSDQDNGDNKNNNNKTQNINQNNTSKSIKHDLINLSMRGRDIGGEGFWDDSTNINNNNNNINNNNSNTIVPNKVREIIQQTEKNIRRQEQKELQKKKVSEWDQMLDIGRQKKIKTGRENSLDTFLARKDNVNKFQEYQNYFIDNKDDSNNHNENYNDENDNEIKENGYNNKKNQKKPNQSSELDDDNDNDDDDEYDYGNGNGNGFFNGHSNNHIHDKKIKSFSGGKDFKKQKFNQWKGGNHQNSKNKFSNHRTYQK